MAGSLVHSRSLKRAAWDFVQTHPVVLVPSRNKPGSAFARDPEILRLQGADLPQTAVATTLPHLCTGVPGTGREPHPFRSKRDHLHSKPLAKTKPGGGLLIPGCGLTPGIRPRSVLVAKSVSAGQAFAGPVIVAQGFSPRGKCYRIMMGGGAWPSRLWVRTG